MKQIEDILALAVRESICGYTQAMTIEFCVEFVARGMKENGFFSDSMKEAIAKNAGSRFINELNNLVKDK